MGAVARAWDLILHTPVAIKFMNPQFLTFPGAEERFINEGKASALIKSDHVVPVMKAGKTASGTPYLVMECLEGVDLADLIARDGPSGLPIERAVHFVLQVLRALQAAHAIGIIHRDMKPSNCFAVTKDGEEDFVKILDFGISKIAEARQRVADADELRARDAALHVARAGAQPARRRRAFRPLFRGRHPLRAAHRPHAVLLRERRVHRDPLQALHGRAAAREVDASRPPRRARRGRAQGARARGRRSLLERARHGGGARAVRERAFARTC